MRGQRKEPLLIICFFLADFGLIGQASRDAAVQSPLPEPTNGRIILGGGYFDQQNTAALLKRMIDLAGGAGASLVIIPTADSQLEPATRAGSSTTLIDYEKAVRVTFARLGVLHVTVLHTRDRRVADSDAFVAPLRSANCVWIPGGDTQLLFGVYPNTRVQRELQGVLNRGGVVAGDSAGAMVIGLGLLAVDLDHPERMPAAPQTGLGLLRHSFVMPHVNRYKAGVVTLGSQTYVSAHPETSGILIEEHTAIIIQHGQVSRLIGNGRAGIADGCSHGTDSVVWLSGSARYDLRTRALVQ
jgi:cyanophycinase